MAQAMQIGTIEAPISMDKKTYTVSFKGLIAHLFDILFTDNTPHTYYAGDMSGHIQKRYRSVSIAIVMLSIVNLSASNVGAFIFGEFIF